jgi:hypothetical protein
MEGDTDEDEEKRKRREGKQKMPPDNVPLVTPLADLHDRALEELVGGASSSAVHPPFPGHSSMEWPHDIYKRLQREVFLELKWPSGWDHYNLPSYGGLAAHHREGRRFKYYFNPRTQVTEAGPTFTDFDAFDNPVLSYIPGHVAYAELYGGVNAYIPDGGTELDPAEFDVSTGAWLGGGAGETHSNPIVAEDDEEEDDPMYAKEGGGWQDEYYDWDPDWDPVYRS